ncbi:FAD-binding and (Fe-S)-binding domain-containing protein [Pseudidiomarina taiwanensis]|uniref:D-2-hydroxyglutarate dehydrogenase n=1 Tax=Pseudidiomarina taiwanensis TaxID=337250 RepID=A0A432ZNB8_9GAMM|nr:FAD-binding and (Fe-S)-binding domain-containing protein [Pseudidiomarina taiwanensis]RUO79389.1 hypothetical protein CWI83_02460 [Pseudidiomarina taiwanensis]
MAEQSLIQAGATAAPAALHLQYQRYLSALSESAFSGEIDWTYAGRLIAATDNSIYQQLPQAVLYPRHTQDVVTALQLAQQDAYQGVRFSPRGGGTGTNGQSLTAGIVIDLSRHMRQIGELNAKQAWVECETGVVKDQLNDAVRDAGLFFSPDLSTSNRATIGGMINTDASGQGSLVYGKTSDHILALTAVLSNGELLEAYEMSVAEASAKAEQANLEGAIYRQVIQTCIGKRDAIAEKFPPLNRFLTGYDLKHAYDPQRQTINIARLLAGSEGTLAVITRARLNLTALPKFKVLVNVKYSDFQAALRNAPFLVKAEATSVETIDSNVLDLARNDIIWHQVEQHLAEVPGQTMNGINMVEFTATAADEIEQKLSRLCQALDELIQTKPEQGVIGYQICREPSSIQTIYAMRKKAVGLLGATKGARKPIAFAEDTAVPPEKLADFITEFRAILDQHQLHYGMFGHVDAGVLHVRPALDMKAPSDQQLLRQISDQVAELTAKYGGLMWGEHGKGYRSEYAPKFFGQELYPEIQKIKAAFDPENRLNPGKLCTPFGSQEQLVSVDAVKRGDFDRAIEVEPNSPYQHALDCNGNGLCFNYAADSAMCPSYKASGNRAYSPKGRASLIREWLRLRSGGQNLAAPLTEFDQQVKQSMDECLACKACANQCPVKVDVPAFRAEFLAWYGQHEKRKLKDYLVRDVERLAPKLAKWPRLANLLSDNPLSRLLLKHVIGYQDAPKLSVPTLQQRWQQHAWQQLSVNELLQTTQLEQARTVVIVQDPFTSFYEAELVEAFAKVAQVLGFEPVLLEFLGNGKAQHVKGFLTEFRATVARVGPQLQALSDAGWNLVGLDASTSLCYQDEYRRYSSQPLSFEVRLPQQWLLQVCADETFAKVQLAPTPASLQLLTHCTEQTALATAAKQWHTVFAQFGLELTTRANGCCGMAGTYGHEAEHQEASRKLYEMSWQEQLAQPGWQTLATGFSCRSQAKRFKQRALHPLQYLAQSLAQGE